MKYEYALESSMPINVTVTFRDLELIAKLIDAYEGDDKWIYDDLRDEIKDIKKKAARSAKIRFTFTTEENDDNA